MEIKEIQNYKLDLLKHIDAICKENNIEYCLYGGTLLGCVRHDGYIPWDDDVDILLKWDDYMKLINIIKKQYSEEYFIQNIFTDKGYSTLFTQLRVNNTTSMPVESKELDIHWGMCIDFFPLIDVYDNNTLFKIQQFSFSLVRSLMSKESMIALNIPVVGKQKIINKIPYTIRLLISKIIFKMFAKCKKKTGYCTYLWHDQIQQRYQKEWFDKYEYHKYEDTELPIPVMYDEVLTRDYGDYMTPPPENERGGHDLQMGYIINDITKDYKEYK